MRAPVVLALLLAACSPGPAAPPAVVTSEVLPSGAWALAAGAPRALTEVAAAALGGQIWVAGGYAEDGTHVADVQVYDPVLDAWSTGPDLPEPVHHSALVSTGSELYLVGGYVEPEGTPTAAVRVLDATTGTWRDGPSLPEPRGAGAAAFDGDRIVYGGGVGPDGVTGDVLVLEGERWRSVGALATAREHLAAASDGEGQVWFLGGRVEGLDTNRPEVDLVSGNEVRAAGALPTPRGGTSGFYAPGAGGCAAGGEGPQGTFVEVECVAPDGTVTVLPDLAEGRHGIGAVTLDGAAYVLLGGPEPGLTVSDSVQTLRLP
jgi:N-acetylneuraminic acid mutarotase